MQITSAACPNKKCTARLWAERHSKPQSKITSTGGTKKHELEGKIVCTCFGVTDKEIERVIRENNLTTVEQVTNYTKAGGGCGGCKGQIQEIIDKIWGIKEKTVAAQKPSKGAKLTNIQKIQLIQQTIDEQIRPALRADGGDIELIDFVGNKVIVALRGMCANVQPPILL